jgi:hypothetical protein
VDSSAFLKISSTIWCLLILANRTPVPRFGNRLKIQLVRVLFMRTVVLPLDNSLHRAKPTTIRIKVAAAALVNLLIKVLICCGVAFCAVVGVMYLASSA